MSSTGSLFDELSEAEKCPVCGRVMHGQPARCPLCDAVSGAAQIPLREKSKPSPLGPWRDGVLIVTPLGTDLPRRCVATNDPVEGLLLKDFTYFPSWMYLVALVSIVFVWRGAWAVRLLAPAASFALFLVGPCLCLLAYLAARKKVTLGFGLSEGGRAAVRRRAARAGVVASAGLAICVWFAVELVTSNTRQQASHLRGGVGFLLFLAGATYGVERVPALRIRKLEGRMAWFSGACPAYLDELPQYEGQTA